MQPTQQEIDKFRIKSRAAALFSQLPDTDLDEARAILAEFMRMCANAGLTVDDGDKSASVVQLR